MPDVKLNIRRSGDWAEVEKLLRNLKRTSRLMDKIIATEARAAAKLVQRNLKSHGKLTGTAWPRLRPLTRKLKKSKKMLQETGALHDAITATKVEGSKWFIGITSTAQHKGKGGGLALAKLARVHEEGATIVQVWSPKQARAFFALLSKAGRTRVSRSKAAVARRAGARRRGLKALGRKAEHQPGGLTVVIRIPARPFIGPVLDVLYINAQSVVEKRIMERLVSALTLPKSRQGKKPK